MLNLLIFQAFFFVKLQFNFFCDWENFLIITSLKFSLFLEHDQCLMKLYHTCVNTECFFPFSLFVLRSSSVSSGTSSFSRRSSGQQNMLVYANIFNIKNPPKVSLFLFCSFFQCLVQLVARRQNHCTRKNLHLFASEHFRMETGITMLELQFQILLRYDGQLLGFSISIISLVFI